MNNNHITSNKTNQTPVRRAQSFKQAPSPLPSSNGNDNSSKNFFENLLFF
jgi:hypothetical protein